jgi:hypothetical protein
MLGDGKLGCNVVSTASKPTSAKHCLPMPKGTTWTTTVYKWEADLEAYKSEYAVAYPCVYKVFNSTSPRCTSVSNYFLTQPFVAIPIPQGRVTIWYDLLAGVDISFSAVEYRKLMKCHARSRIKALRLWESGACTVHRALRDYATMYLPCVPMANRDQNTSRFSCWLSCNIVSTEHVRVTRPICMTQASTRWNSRTDLGNKQPSSTTAIGVRWIPV